MNELIEVSEQMIHCPNCWERTELPPLEYYNTLYRCSSCGIPYIIHDPTGPGGRIDVEAMLAGALHCEVAEMEVYGIERFDLVENKQEAGAVRIQKEITEKIVLRREWNGYATLFAGRKKNKHKEV